MKSSPCFKVLDKTYKKRIFSESRSQVFFEGESFQTLCQTFCLNWKIKLTCLVIPNFISIINYTTFTVVTPVRIDILNFSTNQFIHEEVHEFVVCIGWKWLQCTTGIGQSCFGLSGSHSRARFSYTSSCRARSAPSRSTSSARRRRGDPPSTRPPLHRWVERSYDEGES